MSLLVVSLPDLSPVVNLFANPVCCIISIPDHAVIFGNEITLALSFLHVSNHDGDKSDQCRAR